MTIGEVVVFSGDVNLLGNGFKNNDKLKKSLICLKICRKIFVD